MTEITDY